jgi:hypothetical protein
VAAHWVDPHAPTQPCTCGKAHRKHKRKDTSCCARSTITSNCATVKLTASRIDVVARQLCDSQLHMGCASALAMGSSHLSLATNPPHALTACSGTPSDYDSWGLESWQSKDLVDWFMRAEHYADGERARQAGIRGLRGVLLPPFPFSDKTMQAASINKGSRQRCWVCSSALQAGAWDEGMAHGFYPRPIPC